MFRWIDGLLDRIFAVIGCLVLSQMPQFMMQYTQRLSGHVEELQIHLRMMRQGAALSGKSLEQYVSKFMASQDVDFVHQGGIIKNMVIRYDQLSAGLQAMNESSTLTRPWAFFSHIQYDIAEGTLRSFQPGISFSFETVSYMFIGLIAGFSIYKIIRWLLLKLSPKALSEKKI